MMPDRRPFADAPAARVVLPVPAGPEGGGILSFTTLLRNEAAELTVELGAPAAFAAGDAPLAGAALLIGPAAHNPALAAALHRLGEPPATAGRLLRRTDPATGARLLICDGASTGEAGSALNLLRTAIRTGAATLAARPAANLDEVIARVTDEVASTWPSFGPRGVDWAHVRDRAMDDVRAHGGDVPSLQRWLAPLRDPHTWVKGPDMSGHLPYQLWAEGGRAILVSVARDSAAWAGGARPGDELLDVDVPGWWARTPAEPRVKPRYVGQRILSGPAGEERTMRVRTPAGDVRAWRESPRGGRPVDEIVTWTRVASLPYLRIAGWHDVPAFHDAIDAALADFAAADRLIVDLRGNFGGSLVAAQRFRDRFLRGRTHLGAIRFTRYDGRLAPALPLSGEPSGTDRRWPKPVRFLTDALSYSATEDALLGLQGLAHVQLVGEATGGGSGRPRAIPLWPGVTLTVSTALTFDRTGRGIEGNGIPVDLPVRFAMPAPDGADRALRVAAECW